MYYVKWITPYIELICTRIFEKLIANLSLSIQIVWFEFFLNLGGWAYPFVVVDGPKQLLCVRRIVDLTQCLSDRNWRRPKS